ncbi:MAG: right-handed parallel beta-helix repeat-containing protein [Petrotogales bacterium]
MKNNVLKKILEVGIIFLFIGMGVVPSTGTVEIPSKAIIGRDILYVGGLGPGNYSKIQDAIDDANDGDTIFVYDDSSPYKGYIHVDKSVNIIGENKYTTVVFDDDYYCFSFDVDRINVSGFTLESTANCDYGIRIWETYNHSISNNIITGMGGGIDLTDSNNNSIMNNEIRDGGSGIDIENSLYNQIGFNKFLDNNCGVRLRDYTKNNTVFDNSFENNGIAVWDFSYPNTFYGNLINGKPLIYLVDEQDKILNDISAGEVILIDCINITIQNMEISNSTYGIELINSDKCTIVNNTIESNKYSGIHLIEDCDENSIINNNVNFNSADGISIYGDYFEPCEYNDIIGNNVISNGVNGIYISDSTNSMVSKNIVLKNGFRPYYTIVRSGITLEIRADNNKILQNIVQDNYYGISLWYSSDNLVSNNLIRNCTKTGIYIDESSKNMVEYNNFIDNDKNARFIRYPTLKNYWRSNYWDSWIGIGPKLIWGLRMIQIGVDRWGEPIYSPLPWINIDWFPAKEPYIIGGENEKEDINR